jgi:hypothetical protein
VSPGSKECTKPSCTAWEAGQRTEAGRGSSRGSGGLEVGMSSLAGECGEHVGSPGSACDSSWSWRRADEHVCQEATGMTKRRKHNRSMKASMLQYHLHFTSGSYSRF